MTETATITPTTILIAALGGEGGGVMMNWIVAAARSAGYPVQATSVPGVAQRTGATTYYVEMVTAANLDQAPVLTLSPTPGEVDVLIASELAEAGRALSAGYITTERTTLIASTSRHYTTLEKMAMGEGRIDSGKVRAGLERAAKRPMLFDAAALAEANSTFLNAIMIGAAVGSGALGLDEATMRAAIEAEGKAVAVNLKGFDLGISIAHDTVGAVNLPADDTATDPADGPVALATGVKEFPVAAQSTIAIGLARAIDFQNDRYGQTYLDRLAPFAASSAPLADAVARHLAVRMTYEDIVRVAQVKIRRDRFDRIRGEAKAAKQDTVHVTDFFKPGIPEIADLLPPVMAKKLLRWASKKNRMSRLAWPMHVQTTTVFGFLKVWALAKLRRWRPRSYRWLEEQREIDAWLLLIRQAADLDDAVGIEVADLSRLIKGYGSTHSRGVGNYHRIIDELVRPGLATGLSPQDFAERIVVARDAALADPTGIALAGALTPVGATANYQAAAAD